MEVLPELPRPRSCGARASISGTAYHSRTLGARFGTVLAEQFLPNLTELLRMAEAPWASSEFLLCAPHRPVFRCFLSRYIHSGSCAPAERDLPSLAMIFSQALSVRESDDSARSAVGSRGTRSALPRSRRTATGRNPEACRAHLALRWLRSDRARVLRA